MVRRSWIIGHTFPLVQTALFNNGPVFGWNIFPGRTIRRTDRTNWLMPPRSGTERRRQARLWNQSAAVPTDGVWGCAPLLILALKSFSHHSAFWSWRMGSRLISANNGSIMAVLYIYHLAFLNGARPEGLLFWLRLESPTMVTWRGKRARSASFLFQGSMRMAGTQSLRQVITIPEWLVFSFVMKGMVLVSTQLIQMQMYPTSVTAADSTATGTTGYFETTIGRCGVRFLQLFFYSI